MCDAIGCTFLITAPRICSTDYVLYSTVNDPFEEVAIAPPLAWC